MPFRTLDPAVPHRRATGRVPDLVVADLLCGGIATNLRRVRVVINGRDFHSEEYAYQITSTVAREMVSAARLAESHYRRAGMARPWNAVASEVSTRARHIMP